MILIRILTKIKILKPLGFRRLLGMIKEGIKKIKTRSAILAQKIKSIEIIILYYLLLFFYLFSTNL